MQNFPAGVHPPSPPCAALLDPPPHLFTPDISFTHVSKPANPNRTWRAEQLVTGRYVLLSDGTVGSEGQLLVVVLWVAGPASAAFWTQEAGGNGCQLAARQSWSCELRNVCRTVEEIKLMPPAWCHATVSVFVRHFSPGEGHVTDVNRVRALCAVTNRR